MKKITIIIPAYNEEESLPHLYERLEKLMTSMEHYEFEILFVNDGSKDNTIDLIKEYREKDNRICYVDFSRNFGKEIAMIATRDLVLCHFYGCRFTRPTRIDSRIGKILGRRI